MHSVAVFIPGTLLFGNLFDSACLVWQMTCGTSGACLHYDTTKFRYYMHGVTLIFQVASLLFGLATLYFVKQRFSGKDDEEDEKLADEKKSPIVKDTSKALLKK